LISTPAVIGVAPHAGWGIFVCVAIDGGIPVVLDRRRSELIEAGLPTQPYHHETLTMDHHEADALVSRVRMSVAECARRALDQIRRDVGPNHEVTAIAIREAPYPRLPESVAEVHNAGRLLYAADGMIYQHALCDAAEKVRLEVYRHHRGDELRRAAEALGSSEAAVDGLMNELRHTLGPPWTKEHRMACAASIAVLARLGAIESLPA
jgi:hypothetical protein